MDIKTLAEQHPQLLAAIQAEAQQAGATAEINRIKDVRAQSLPGHEALIERLAMDGVTTGPQAAAAVLSAERQLREAAAAAVFADAPAAAPASAAPSAANEASDRAAQAEKAKAYAKEHNVSFLVACRELGIS
jgi:hypothetical protein